MQFKDVIGQQSVKHHLAEMVYHNRLSHALLFLGKEGSGALPLAPCQRVGSWQKADVIGKSKRQRQRPAAFLA